MKTCILKSIVSVALAVLCGFSIISTAAPVKPNNLPTEIGKGEGQLNIISWEGYAQDKWVEPFERKTGCQVHRKYAGSSDEMVALMRQGGGSTYDLVSASGDASLRLIYGGNVQPINIKLFPSYKNFLSQLKSPPFNTVNGVHYGLSYEWGPNILLYNTNKVQPEPQSWKVIYSKKFAGKITVPDNPIQIADAALYLKAHNSSLGIKDPYELTPSQLDAVKKLLKKQRPLIVKYWSLASTEISLFKNGGAVVGAAWPYATNTLKAADVPVADTIPKEGVTGWADSWMLSVNAPHPNCAYMWMKYVSKPEVQAEQALYFGETPANKRACKTMNDKEAGSCSRYHLNAPASYFNKIKFWKTPRRLCDSQQGRCTTYKEWQRVWQEIKG